MGYINKAAERLVGSASGDSHQLEGYISQEGGAVRPLLDQVNQLVENVAGEYETICRQYWQQNCDAVLSDIIADKPAFDTQTGLLENLRKELSTTKEQI